MIWAVTDPEWVSAVAAAYAAVDVLYIADGHHRSAAGARVSAMRDGRDGSGTAHQRFLIVAFPANELNIVQTQNHQLDLKQ